MTWRSRLRALPQAPAQPLVRVYDPWGLAGLDFMVLDGPVG